MIQSTWRKVTPNIGPALLLLLILIFLTVVVSAEALDGETIFWLASSMPFTVSLGFAYSWQSIRYRDYVSATVKLDQTDTRTIVRRILRQKGLRYTESMSFTPDFYFEAQDIHIRINVAGLGTWEHDQTRILIGPIDHSNEIFARKLQTYLEEGFQLQALTVGQKGFI